MFAISVLGIISYCSCKDDKSINISCPTWTFYADNQCQCGQGVQIICDKDSLNIYVKKCHCVTYSEAFQEVVLSSCMYNCHLLYDERLFYRIPRNATLLNDKVCGVYNRDGQGCSYCKKGYGIAIYSYDNFCVQCIDYKYNWLKYITIAYLPITVLYILVLCGRITVTNNILSGYVLGGQLFATPLVAQLMGLRRLQFGNSKYSLGIKLFFLLYGIWNLDFGRSLYKPFCLYPHLSEFHVIALDYCLALYPLFLILLTYILLQLHDTYKVVNDVFKPMRYIFRILNKPMNIKASLVDVFVTFILLSNVKFLLVSYTLMSIPITFVNLVSAPIQMKYVYLNESMEYMGKEHMPFFVLGIIAVIALNLIPMLMVCLYPCRCFQKCLNRFELNSQSIRSFMDAFQGYYKTRPRDYRWFAATPFLIVNLNFLSFYLSMGSYYFTMMGFVLAIYSFVILCLRPFQKFKMNCSYSFFCLDLSLFYFYNNRLSNIALFNLPFQSIFSYIYVRIDIILGILPTAIILLVALSRVMKYLKRKFSSRSGELTTQEYDPLL